ncbi:MAG TPA: ATP-binding protein, partial [Chitinophagaceae bacterium]|nr:ATP-binding protein [Chitinophagaceae bacterium]
GLPNNTIYCILPDKSGKIWCSTNKGIFRLNPATGEINAFEKWDGLPGNEFNRTQKFLFPDGRMAFGGLDGYTIFNPADFDKPREALNVAVRLTSLQINNEPQDRLQPGSIIKEPLSTLSSMRLPYNKNYLRFEFAAMLFNQPQKTKYRYKMEGADTRWIENGTSNVISYAALRPGKYKLLINATDNNGNWSNTFKELAIIIDPPFWATWWAYIIYALMAAGLARWYFIYREKRIKTEQNLAFEKREALRLKEMDEVKDRFFSNITHEFRTPLTLIITPLDKLTRDHSLPAPATQTLKTIQKNSHQLLRLINELLDFSKLNDGRMKVKLFSGELSLFLANCVQSFEAAAREKNIRFSYSSKDVEGFYLFDEEKWEKIIANLLSNALKFTPRDGMVSVSVAGLPDERIRIEVKDSGPGIPADQQQKIFERFYQADSSSIRNYGGTGIGLSLVKELVELMNGTIEVDSIPENYSRFIAEIPVQKILGQETVVSHPVETASPSAMQNNEQDGPLIMIVEDNDELRSLLLENMSSRYRVIAAADGLQAWDIITSELPDIVISDVMMPGRDGFELCRLCKSDNRTAHIGFILLTSKATHDARMVGLETGADGYMTKPFHLDELELSTANLLQLQQKVRSQLQAQLLSNTPQVHLPAVTNPFLIHLYAEMDAKIDEPELGVDYLCKAMAMSRSTLNRKLKLLLDISPNDLIRQYRLQKATGYLTAGMDIATTAYKVGFSSHAYFSQCFREQYGITPSDYVSKQT